MGSPVSETVTSFLLIYNYHQFQHGSTSALNKISRMVKITAFLLVISIGICAGGFDPAKCKATCMSGNGLSGAYDAAHTAHYCETICSHCDNEVENSNLGLPGIWKWADMIKATCNDFCGVIGNGGGTDNARKGCAPACTDIKILC